MAWLVVGRYFVLAALIVATVLVMHLAAADRE